MADGDLDRIDALLEGWSREAPELTTAAFALIKRVARLHGLLESALLDRLKEWNLSTAEYDILTTLRSTGSPFHLRPSTLAERTVLSSGGISNALRRLEARDLVTKRPDERDARSSWIQLTDAGADLAVDSTLDVVAAQSAILEAAGAQTRVAASALRDVLLAIGDRAS